MGDFGSLLSTQCSLCFSSRMYSISSQFSSNQSWCFLDMEYMNGGGIQQLFKSGLISFNIDRLSKSTVSSWLASLARSVEKRWWQYDSGLKWGGVVRCQLHSLVLISYDSVAGKDWDYWNSDPHAVTKCIFCVLPYLICSTAHAFNRLSVHWPSSGSSQSAGSRLHMFS